MEQWKSLKGIVDCGDNYEISNLGNVRNVKTKKLRTPQLRDNGYLATMLSYKGKVKNYLIHRLVALAFIPNPENKPMVNHLDGIKINDWVDNLEWSTGKENSDHAYENGLANNRGSNNVMARLTESDVVEIKKLLVQNVLHEDIAERFSIAKTAIAKIQRGERWAYVDIEGFTPYKQSTPKPKAKLTTADIEKIKELYSSGEYTMNALGQMFNASRQRIGRIVNI